MTLLNRMLSRASLSAATITLASQLFASSAFALEKEEAIQSLEDIHQTIIKGYYSINSFYNFTVNQGDQKYLDEINDSTTGINELVSTVSAKFSDGTEADTLSQITESWESYKKLLDENIEIVSETGYTDNRVTSDMAAQNIGFNLGLHSLYDNIIENDKVSPDTTTKASRDAITTMALMMTKYSARSTAAMSEVYVGGNANVTIDELAYKFDEQIAQLAQISEGNEGALDLIDSAKTKWDFIRASYINYNENRVNFIVNLHSKKIIEDIEAAANLL